MDAGFFYYFIFLCIIKIYKMILFKIQGIENLRNERLEIYSQKEV